MTDAWKKTIRDITIIIIVGIAYYFINRFTGFGIKCAFNELTGLKCPSCGISHMFIHLAELDPKSAMSDNQFLFFTWPLVAVEIIYLLHKHESNKDIPKWNIVAISVFAALLTIFGIIRIIYKF